jgi:ligand-binding sensor domain-containing protein
MVGNVFLHAHKIFLTKALVLLFFIFTPSVVFSQQHQLRFQHITVENGLSQNTVQGIVQDKYGFMWFGTWNGLCKYDGYKFITYREEPDRKNSIDDNRIHLLYKDHRGDIWVSFSKSRLLCRYNYETDDFTRFRQDQVAPSLIDSLYRPKRQSNKHVASRNYAWRIDPTEKLLVQTGIQSNNPIVYKTDPLNPWGINDEFVNDLYLSNDDVLWVGTYNIGINKADTWQKKFHHYNRKHLSENSLTNNIIRTICEDKEGNLQQRHYQNRPKKKQAYALPC